MYDFDHLKFLLSETKSKYYSPELRRLTDNIFSSHRIISNAMDSIALMKEAARVRSLDLNQYPSIAIILKISGIEKSLREVTLDAQRKELIMAVNDVTAELQDAVLDAHMGRFPNYSFFEILIIQAHKLSIDVRRFRELNEYVWVNLKMKSLKSSDVKSEILTCLDYLRDDLFTTDDQKMIFHIEKEVDILYNGYKMSLSLSESDTLEQFSRINRTLKELETELINILNKPEVEAKGLAKVHKQVG